MPVEVEGGELDGEDTAGVFYTRNMELHPVAVDRGLRNKHRVMGQRHALDTGGFRETEAGGERPAAKFVGPSIYVSYRPLKPRGTPGRATVQGACALPFERMSSRRSE